MLKKKKRQFHSKFHLTLNQISNEPKFSLLKKSQRLDRFHGRTLFLVCIQNTGKL